MNYSFTNGYLDPLINNNKNVYTITDIIQFASRVVPCKNPKRHKGEGSSRAPVPLPPASLQPEQPPVDQPEASTHPWFSTKTQERIFNESFATKALVPPKVLHLDWLTEQGFQFHTLLKDHDLNKFVGLSGFYYPDLVRVFYTNLHADPATGYLCSEVKCTRIQLSPDDLEEIAGLKDSGVKPRLADLKDVGFELDKNVFYQSLLRDPTAWLSESAIKRNQKKKVTYNTGGLNADDRLLHYIVCWILAVRGGNHATISEKDMLLMGAITNSIILNWVHVISDNMLKTRCLMDYKCPYAFLVHHR
ncbi:hypothetical protein Fmac_010042 [Flemingia macrophylla]|uniref:Uncharacterized protein n=1 Tax=Flemingia macrophylla TaxID=520843 RepID=A0ABD1N1X9_9FABA